ncbi:MAG: transposase [Desulfobacterales bacterium]|nr:transposase [Desulfobacterales bacterium]
MIRIKDHKQQHLFDPWRYLSPKRRRMLEEGWPGLFRQHLLGELPIDRLKPFFTEAIGRPTKELHTLLGVMLFQQTMDLNDAEAVDQLAYNIQWHYALDITEESDEAKYISEKTLWSTRQLMAEHGIEGVMFEKLTDKLAKVFGVDPANQRIDSVHICSNMRRLGRIAIFSRTIAKFLVNLKRHHRERFDTLKADLIDRYWGDKALAAFSLVKPTESEKTLKQVSNDLFDLLEQFKGQAAVSAMHSYKLMQRVLSDQCRVETDDAGSSQVTIKKPAEIPSDSLQNPSDPDATYSGHKGQGYQVQIMETFSRSEDETEKEQTLNLITHVEVQPACESDATALLPAVADTRIRGVGPDQLVADTLYGSDRNHQTAKVADVELIAPSQKGNASKPLTEFRFNDKGYVESCPAGHTPEQVKHKKKTDRYSAAFDPKLCQGCPHVDHCPVKPGKRKNYLRYSGKQYRLWVRRRAEHSEAFIDAYRWRAGVEATMSEYDRLTGVKKLRVRGMPAVRFCAKMKAIGLNLLRAARARRARMKAAGSHQGLNRRNTAAIYRVKERIQAAVLNFSAGWPNSAGRNLKVYKLAA